MLDENFRARDNLRLFGGIAQLVERVVRNDEAWGSNPHTSTDFASAKFKKYSRDANAVRLVGRDSAGFQSRFCGIIYQRRRAASQSPYLHFLVLLLILLLIMVFS